MNEFDSRGTDGLDAVEALLRQERPEATALELDQMKLRAIRAATSGRSRPTRLRGAIVKSRLALMSMIVVGVLMSGTGATVAVTGIAGDGSSGIAQYGPDNQDVAGVQEEGGDDGDAGDDGGVLGDSDEGAAADDVQGSAQEAADGDNRLPFTGFLAIPLLIGGVGLLTSGVVLRRRLD